MFGLSESWWLYWTFVIGFQPKIAPIPRRASWALVCAFNLAQGCALGKLIIMTDSKAASTGVGLGDIDPNEFQRMSIALKVVETLTRMDQRVVTLESTVKQDNGHIDAPS
jgi:hypothetical protein